MRLYVSCQIFMPWPTRLVALWGYTGLGLLHLTFHMHHGPRARRALFVHEGWAAASLGPSSSATPQPPLYCRWQNTAANGVLDKAAVSGKATQRASAGPCNPAGQCKAVIHPLPPASRRRRELHPRDRNSTGKGREP
jgi:hypothetical protein